MMKRLLSLLLTLAILLGAMPGLAETAVPVLRSAEIASLKALAGDAQTGATWHEGMSPSASMNALQMWQWTDWFLSEKLRSLLGSAQDYIQLASGLSGSTFQADVSTLEWELRALEDQLTYYEEQLSDGRTAILNGIRLYQDVSASAYDRARAYDRMMEAKEEILQAIKTISANYADYTALVARCSESMLAAPINESMLFAQTNSVTGLMDKARTLEISENAADAIDFDVTVISTKQICIAVYDSDKNPLSGALVHLVNNKDSKRTKDAVTGSDGRAVFWVSDLVADEKTDMKLGLRVTANGYFDADDSAAKRNEMRTQLAKQRTEDYANGDYARAGGVIDPLPDDAPQFVRDYHAYYKTPRGYHARSVNSNAGWNVTSSLPFMNMPLMTYIGEIENPALLIHGEKAHSLYFSKAAYEKLEHGVNPANKELLIIPGANHTDLYDNLNAIPFDTIAGFFTRNL